MLASGPVRIIAAAFLLAIASPAFAIILSDNNQVPAGQRPSDSVVGRFDGNATCVAIAPNYVLSTLHEGSAAGQVMTFNVNGVNRQFEVLQTSFAPNNVDLQVVKIANLDGTPANLKNYVPVTASPVAGGTNIVIGGYGQGRGTTLTNSHGAYGYTWDGSDNTTLRWGQNTIDGTSTQSYSTWWGTASEASYNADFDGPTLGVPYEACIAMYDSGCPWFVKVGNQWQVAAVSTYTDAWLVNGVYQSRFAGAFSGNPAPDPFYGVQLSAYANWIRSMAPVSGDFNNDGSVNDADYTVWADYFGKTPPAGYQRGNGASGGYNDADYTIWADNYTGASGGTVPEPASVALLGLGMLLPRLRRK